MSDPVTETEQKLAAQAQRELTDRIVAVVLATNRVRSDKIARILREQEEGPGAPADPEFVAEVRRCMDTGYYLDALELARENPVQHLQTRALRAAPMALESVIGLASEHNDDKRTRTSNAQFLLAAGAGLSATQRHAVTADQAFVDLVQAVFTGPKAEAEEG